MNAEEDSFPFSICLCRPCLQGEGQPFAEVSYRRHFHQILRWPCHSFPFELASSGKMEIQVFLAEDESAFQQQYRQAMGCCTLNLDTLVEARSLRVLLQRRERLASLVWAMSVTQQEFDEVFDLKFPDEEDILVNRWRAKYEEQRKSVDLLKQEHDADLAKMNQRIQRSKDKTKAVLELSGTVVWQCLVNVAFCAWAGWVGEEKNQRQFDQLAEDSRLFQARSEGAKEAALQEVRQLEQEKDTKRERQQSLRESWRRKVSELNSMMQRAGLGLVTRAFMKWVQFLQQREALARMSERLLERGSNYTKQMVFLAWQSFLGDLAWSEQTKQVEIKEAAALEAVRQSLGALDTAAERLARCDRLHEALQSWRGATRRHRRRIAGGTGRVKGRKPPADGAEQKAQQEVLKRRRLRTRSVMQLPCVLTAELPVVRCAPSAMFCCCAAEPGPANEMPFGGSEEKFRDAFVKTAPAMASPDFIPDVFEVKLKDGSHGIVIDVTDPDCTIIKNLRAEGVVLNDEALRPCLICPMNSQEFDRVLEVNGVRGSSVEMATALGSDNEPLTLTLQRPEERTVKLQRPGEIGVVLNYKKLGSKAPWITKISPGLLTRWNEDMPDQAVGLHDRVKSVNGVTGAPEDLMNGIKDSKESLVALFEHKLQFLEPAGAVAEAPAAPEPCEAVPAPAAPPEDEKYAVYRRMHRTGVMLPQPAESAAQVAAGCPAGDHAAFSDKMNDSGVGFGLWCYYPLSLFMFCAWCIVSIKDPSLDVAILDTFDGAAGTGAGAPIAKPAKAPPKMEVEPKQAEDHEPPATPKQNAKEPDVSQEAEASPPPMPAPSHILSQGEVAKAEPKKSEARPAKASAAAPAVPKAVHQKEEEPAPAPQAAPPAPVLFGPAESTAPKARMPPPAPKAKAKASTPLSPEAALKLRRSVVAQVQDDDVQSDVSDF
eukprot:g31289.t1